LFDTDEIRWYNLYIKLVVDVVVGQLERNSLCKKICSHSSEQDDQKDTSEDKALLFKWGFLMKGELNERN